MKLLKWLLGAVAVLVLIIGVGVVALVYLVDWNDFKDTIQNQVKKETGRDLQISGDLSPSVFPWAGISIGEISLANAEGYGDTPFARIESADVKVKLLPLIKREVNVRTVQLKGLQLDLQKAADGTTNWDDLLTSTTTTTTKVDKNDANTQVTTEVEGSSATIAALSVGGIEVLDANVSWQDATTGTDAALTGFNLTTGAIELEKPFMLNVDFSLTSKSMELSADVEGAGELMVDLDSQLYTIKGFTLTTDAKGEALPAGQLLATLTADVNAQLAEQKVDMSSLTLSALGIKLDGVMSVANLDTEPSVTGQFSSNEFNPRELFEKLGVEPPVTADDAVLSTASLKLALAATPTSAALNDLSITLDQTNFTGKASLPSFEGAMPPVRFDFAVDAIDLDRYLPPGSDGSEAPGDSPAPAPGGGDTPIELPTEMMRQLDIDGVFRVGSVKVSNLTTRNIVVPVKASGGKLALQNMTALLYQGQFNGTASLDVTGSTPRYGANVNLAGIQADPLLADLLQKKSFLSGAGEVSANISTTGNTSNELTKGLNGKFNTAFTDGSINGVNIGYQIRRAKAALSAQPMPEEKGSIKTDFTSLKVGGTLTNGVMQSDDLDMRSPLIRLEGVGKVDVPGEYVDYTLTTLITGTSQGQGGADLAALKGLKLDVPIRGSFAELSGNIAGVILTGVKSNITGNLKNQAKALADQKASELKAQARELQQAKEAELRKQAEDAGNKAVEDVKDKLKGLFK